MGKKEERLTRKRLTGSYITTIVSISLVLFMLGLMGFLVLNARNLSNYAKENMGFSVEFDEGTKEVEIARIQKIFEASPYVKETEVVTKEDAALELKEDIGEDFVDFLGFNPLSSHIKVRFYANYANPDSIKVIEQRFKEYSQVKELVYEQDLLLLLNENIKKLSLLILGFSLLLFIISFALINNTIRLSIYSKRFIINTMKLVGATRSFIRWPFFLQSFVYGFIGALIAILGLVSFIYALQNEYSGIIAFNDVKILGALFIIVIILGVFISSVSTHFAVNKYLRIKKDNLYY